MSFKYFFYLQAAKSEVLSLKNRLRNLKSALTRSIDDIDEKLKIEYTGWYVLLKKNGDKWEAITCINPDNCEEVELDIAFDLLMPIPEPATVREFEGF